jgi:tetratricopeptide (TPR) repeat protein
LIARARTHLENYDIDGALQSIQMAQECLDELDNDKDNLGTQIIVLQLEGDIFDEKGQIEKGISSLKKAVEIAEKNDIVHGLSTSYRRIGDLLLKRYDWDNTLEHYLKSLHLSKVEEDEGEVAWAFKGLGRIYLLKGDYHRSMECYIKYMEHPETRSGPANVRGMTEIGDIYSQMGDFNQALAYYKLAIKKGDEGSIKNETSLAYIKMADVLLKLGEFEDSRRFADLAREAVHSTDPSTATLETLLYYTDLMLEVGQMDKAEEVVSELEGSIDGMDRLLRAFAYRVKGVLLSRQRDFRGSISQMKAAVNTLEELNVPYDLAMTYFHFGLIRFQQMDVEGALEMLKKASKIFKEIKSMYYLNRTSSKLREVSFIREGLRN